jgi:hypothetical protein
MLAHYTRRAGLEGIARTGTLWAFNFLDLKDTSEFTYAMQAIFEASLDYLWPRIFPEFRDGRENLGKESIAEKLRERVSSGDGYGHLFVACFENASERISQNDGSLTHWQIYAGLDGYCLLFTERYLQDIISSERDSFNYDLIQLAPVKYGIDESDPLFISLVEQFAKQLVLEVLRARSRQIADVDLSDCWVRSRLEAELMRYCATHKHPAFRDEREVRIVAYPRPMSEGRFLRPALRREIHLGPDNRKHIAIREGIWPGISPQKIILGPTADESIGNHCRLFHRPPEVVRSSIPVR